MKGTIDTLKRDIEIHEEVERELAKRSHFCQKVIKRLRQEVKDLTDEKKELKSNASATGGKRGGAVGGVKNHDNSLR